jgi:peptidoglycan/LPS O-acetylase OafA/YrhL
MPVESRSLWRWIAAATFFVAVGAAVWVVPRLGARSPITVVVLCVAAVLTMKLVERRVRQFFQRWAERQAAQGAKKD